ncbi:MAG: nuclear transport factor 2 family protein [Sphingobium phenoxybenzoativorans]|uniref:Nuclear transport factor 2 family protein n=1 Tax=Sphingobium phenoxybenzoativorans TaxID=1592790 RepID=A0A975Q1U5_9SPHN|nr:nuclear transport factor 2 family protein [Sphingobium phenoxybenzoativorans]QUT05787.1 nuclear transport factor 2 family protein [Sphingobium phenoxybenzoativorans]
MSIEAIAEAFFKAIEQGDVDTLNRLYADDAGVWHNFDGITQTKAEGVQTLAQFAAVADSRYELQQRYVVGDTVIQRHNIHIRMKATGASKVIPVAVFLKFRDGKVAHIYEYLDSAHVVAEAFEGVADMSAA